MISGRCVHVRLTRSQEATPRILAYTDIFLYTDTDTACRHTDTDTDTACRHTDTQTLQEATPECSECNVSHLTDIHSSSHQSVNCWILTLSAVGTFSLRVLIGLPVFLIHISINDMMHYYIYTSFSHLPCTVRPL